MSALQTYLLDHRMKETDKQYLIIKAVEGAEGCFGCEEQQFSWYGISPDILQLHFRRHCPHPIPDTPNFRPESHLAKANGSESNIDHLA